jgi:hypothetical protein
MYIGRDVHARTEFKPVIKLYYSLKKKKKGGK